MSRSRQCRARCAEGVLGDFVRGSPRGPVFLTGKTPAPEMAWRWITEVHYAKAGPDDPLGSCSMCAPLTDSDADDLIRSMNPIALSTRSSLCAVHRAG